VPVVQSIATQAAWKRAVAAQWRKVRVANKWAKRGVKLKKNAVIAGMSMAVHSLTPIQQTIVM